MGNSEQTKEQNTYSFEAEIQKLLELLANSLYSNKEIFIRELVSNASDALDKLHFLSISDPDLMGNDSELKIRVEVDKDKKTLKIIDNGIGMDADEVKENIGTIARSGSKAFVQSLSGDNSKDLQLIGQFGVGFYSVFMVAKSVTVVTKKAGADKAFKWVCEGKGTYSLEEVEKSSRGTEITLDLKEGEEEFLEEWKVKEVIKKFSDYVAYNILMEEADLRSEKEKEEDEKNGKEFTPKDEVVNSGKPLWVRKKDEITDEMYNDFYKHISHDFEEPALRTHFNQEGLLSFSSILFIPKRPPFDLFTNHEQRGVHLYVKRVFIMDDCKNLMPQYLRFVKGIVDSEDLPLNVSREILQQNKMLDKIRKNLVKKTLDLLKQTLSKERDQYLEFWKNFGSVLKEGVHLDFENKDKIADICLFKSSQQKGENDWTSLDAYVKGMKEGQKGIYFITGENIPLIESSPHLEIFREKGIEVLYLTDPVDEWVTMSLNEFNGKKLISVTQGELDLGDLDEEKKKEKKEESEKEYQGLMDKFRSSFQEQIKNVRLSSRLTDSPCCLVADEGEMSANMERILKMSQQGAGASTKKILELNPEHEIIKGLNKIVVDKDKDGEIQDWLCLLYDQALLAEGSKVKDAKAFNRRINQLLSKAL